MAGCTIVQQAVGQLHWAEQLGAALPSNEQIERELAGSDTPTEDDTQ